jgi:hypothetical protein
MTNTYKNSTAVTIIIIACAIGYLFLHFHKAVAPVQLDPTPQNVTLSGTYKCLSKIDTTGPQTEECAFGFKTDDGIDYAVNFGSSADAMNQFMSGKHVTAEGFVVIKEALNTDQWEKYNMKGIFTVTKVVEQAAPVNGKLNIDAVCNSALAYMTFPNDGSVDVFVAECKEGKHPEVIERYKKENGFGDGAKI